MTSFLELVQHRSSVRKFQNKTVDRSLLLQCVEAARLAPSADNAQPWRYLIIDDEAVKQRVVEHAFSGIYRATRWAAAAPVLVILFAQLDIVANRLAKRVTGIPYYLIDMGISGEHFVLQAHELGLGTCWIGWFSAKGVHKALQVPKSFRPVEIIAVGYPSQPQQRGRKRKSLEEICTFNEYA